MKLHRFLFLIVVLFLFSCSYSDEKLLEYVSVTGIDFLSYDNYISGKTSDLLDRNSDTYLNELIGKETVAVINLEYNGKNRNYDSDSRYTLKIEYEGIDLKVDSCSTTIYRESNESIELDYTYIETSKTIKDTIALNSLIYGSSNFKIYANDNLIYDYNIEGVPSYFLDLKENNEAIITKYFGNDKDLVIPAKIGDYTITGILKDTFSNSIDINTITIPETINYVELNAFLDKIETVNIKADNLGAIKNSGAKNIIVTSGTKIEKQALFNACYLESITLPDTITEIDSEAFMNCYKLKEIIIPSGVTEIKEKTFNNCYSFTSFTINEGISSILDEAFLGCERLVEVINKSNLTLSLESTENGYITYYAKSILSDASESKITEDNDFVLYDSNCLISYNGNLKNITIPNNIKVINSYAFYKSNVEEVIIGDNIKEISAKSFYEADFLKSVSLPNSIDVIGEKTFYGCDELVSINIPETIKEIKDYAFYYCKKLENINLPKGLTYIGKMAFSNCESLKNVVIPSGIDTIKSYAFASCITLESVDIPDTVITIENSAFESCKSISSIKIPDSVTSIGDYAFYNNNVEFLSCPSTFVNLFINEKLKEVVITSGEKLNKDALREAKALVIITLPDTLKEIDDTAFYQCFALESINIPEGVTTIGELCFAFCSNLKEVYLPSTMEKIGDRAFQTCSNLKDIYYNGTKESYNKVTKTINMLVNVLDYTIHCSDADICYPNTK